MNDFDYREYWKTRHKQHDSLRSSGLKAIGTQSNKYIYKILEDQYKEVLQSLDLSRVSSVIDCGFGDGYFLNFFQTRFPEWDIHGLDISENAKKKASEFFKKRNLRVIDLTSQIEIKERYDIAHCFDVLYHILDDDGYYTALSNIAKLSQTYVILHERFLQKPKRFSAQHVRYRPQYQTTQILNEKGFYLYKQVPTHFFALRTLTYRLNRFMPKLLYKIDSSMLKRHLSTQEAFASHKIRVYKRANNFEQYSR